VAVRAYREPRTRVSYFAGNRRSGSQKEGGSPTRGTGESVAGAGWGAAQLAATIIVHASWVGCF